MADIQRGMPMSGTHCAVALATKRAVRGKHNVRYYGVRTIFIQDEYGPAQTLYAVPKKVLDFATKFDDGAFIKGKARTEFNKTLKPFSFVARLHLS